MKKLLMILLLMTSMSFGSIYQFSANPRSTYLQTSFDFEASPLVIDLSSLGINVGDEVTISTYGSYCAFLFDVCNPQPLGTVFSISNTVLASNTLNRIPGAIDTGVDVLSQPTFFGNHPTDISQDFLAALTGTTVFTQGQYLIAGVLDTYYADNYLWCSQLGIQIETSTIPTTDTPEAGTLSLFLLGLGTFSVVLRCKMREEDEFEEPSALRN